MDGEHAHYIGGIFSLHEGGFEISKKCEDDRIDTRPTPFDESVENQVHLFQGNEGSQQREEPSDNENLKFDLFPFHQMHIKVIAFVSEENHYFMTMFAGVG